MFAWPLMLKPRVLDDADYSRPRLPKKFETFYFFRITRAKDFKQHMAGLVPLLTTADDASKLRNDIYEKKAAGTLKSLIKLSAINVSFSATGLKKVSPFHLQESSLYSHTHFTAGSQEV